MSTIIPTNDSNITGYYQKELSRLEDDHRNEVKRTREQNDQQLGELEDRYKTALLKKDEDNDKAVQYIRDSAKNSLSKEKEKYQESLDRLKDKTYNNRGISGAGYPAATGELETYYHQGFDKLRDQIKNETEFHQHQEKTEADRLENAYKADLSKKDKDFEEAITVMRETSKNASAHEKENFQSELEKLKSQNYNNKGLLSNSIPYSTHKKEITELQEGFDKQREEASRNNSSHKKEESFRNDINRREKESSEAMAKARDSHQASFKQQREDHLSEVEKLKGENGELRTRASKNVPFSEHKKAVTDLQERSDRRHELDLQSNEENSKNTRMNIEQISRKNDERVQTLTNQKSEEIHDLEDKLGTLSGFNIEEGKKQSETQARLIREFENGHRSDQKRDSDAYEAIIGKLKQSSKEHDDLVAGRTNQTLKEKDSQWSKIISDQNKDNYETQKSSQNEFKHQVEELQKGRKHDSEKAQASQESLLARANEQRDHALQNQAKNFSETLNHERKSNMEEVETLQKALQTQKTTEDTSLLSPAAEASLRKSLVKEYEKTLNIEVDKNKASTDQMQQKYASQYQKVIQEYGEKEEQINRQSAYQVESERARFQDSIADIEDQSQTKLLNKDREFERTREVLVRNFSHMLERQRKEFEHSFAVSRDDAAQKLMSVQRDAELNAKMVQRAFTKQQNEIIREYEKKLADQQAEFDMKLEDVKVQTQVDLRDLERRSSKDLEFQSKGYEQRIAQLEAQYKERERYLAQNYQDELDRTKRSYELGSKKKS